jgi:pimeloyl-ACP methyl ester carboxylesterase
VREPDGTQEHDEPQLLPVVLIHGLIGTLDDDDLLNRLAPRPALAVDLLGYGRHRDQAPDGIDSQVEHLRRVLDGAHLGRVHLVGHSAGGVVAVLFAHRHPDRVASLVNVEGNFTLVDAFWSTKVTRMGPERFAEVLAGYQSEPAGWLRESGIRPDERRVALARR